LCIKHNINKKTNKEEEEIYKTVNFHNNFSKYRNKTYKKQQKGNISFFT